MCLDYGNSLIALDSVFSSLHNARGAVDETFISKHESQVKNVFAKWK